MSSSRVSARDQRVIRSEHEHARIADLHDPADLPTAAVAQPPGDDVAARVDAAADNLADARRAETIVNDEIVRLGAIFDRENDASLLNRWIAGDTATTTGEFDELLWTALEWQHCSHGVFNVSMRRLQRLWHRAALDGCQPSVGELQEIANDIATAPYRFDGHLLRQTKSCRDLDLAAIVDGFIVDLATETAWRTCDLCSLIVSARGKVVHRGDGDIDVAIGEPCDLAATTPMATLSNTAFATWRPGGQNRRQIGRSFDPRTGQRLDTRFSVTVVAANATTADAVAPIVSVMTPHQGLAFVEALNAPSPVVHPAESFTGVVSGPIECWIVDAVGETRHAGP